MTLMAGFDFVAEISNSALLNLIKTHFTIQGTPANPPFEFDIPVKPLGANAHVIVKELLLNLADDDRMTLILKFQQSSVIAQSPPIAIAPLDGDLSITAPLQLTAQPPLPLVSTSQVLTIDFGAAEVVPNYTPQTDNIISQSLAGSGIDPHAFKDASRQAVAGFIQGMGQLVLKDVAFPVKKGADGTLSPLRFERLEVHCIGNPDPMLQALAFFGILFAASDKNGDHTLKTATAIVPGSSPLGPRNVAISLSPEAFHMLIFCPGITDALADELNNLPMLPDMIDKFVPIPCGTGEFVKDGLKLYFLFDSFADGHVNIDGVFSWSKPCVTVNGSIHGNLTFSISGTTITPSIQWDDPDVDADVDFVCGMFGGPAISVVALFNWAIVGGIADVMARWAPGFVESVLGHPLPPNDAPGFANTEFDLVTPTIEGLTLHGTIPMVVPFKSGVPHIFVSGSVENTNKELVSIGMYHYPGFPTVCDAKDFPYRQFAQEQTATYQAIPELMGLPLQLEWRIDNTPLTNTIGTLIVPQVCHYPFPLDQGGTFIDQDVHLDYVIGEDSIQLKNIPAEGNYAFDLTVKATDPSGIVAEDGAYVIFEGDTVAFSGGYEDYVNQCQKAMREWVHQHTDDFTASTKPTPRWVRIDKPAPEKLGELLYSLAASSNPLIVGVLTQTITAHHASILGVVLGPKTGSITGVKGKIKGSSG